MNLDNVDNGGIVANWKMFHHALTALTSFSSDKKTNLPSLVFISLSS